MQSRPFMLTKVSLRHFIVIVGHSTLQEFRKFIWNQSNVHIYNKGNVKEVKGSQFHCLWIINLHHFLGVHKSIWTPYRLHDSLYSTADKVSTDSSVVLSTWVKKECRVQKSTWVQEEECRVQKSRKHSLIVSIKSPNKILSMMEQLCGSHQSQTLYLVLFLSWKESRSIHQLDNCREIVHISTLHQSLVMRASWTLPYWHHQW